MSGFNNEYANQLKREHKYDELVEYCSSFPSNGEALALLATCYYYGNGVHQDYDMCFCLDSKSAEMGCPDGMAALGYDYIYGYGTQKDEQKGIQYLNTSVKLGSALAARYLGLCYKKGMGVNQDIDLAIEWYLNAIEQGDAVAMRLLGKIYEDGEFVEKDEHQSIEWYCKATERGDHIAMRYLAICYADGTGVERDESKAVEWYQREANCGDITAMRYFRDYYEYSGPKLDEKKAFEWCQKAANLGDVESMYYLAVYYRAGNGVMVDDHLAFCWYKKAAELGNVNSMIELGRCYEAAIGTQKDGLKAFEWYFKASELDDACAMREVAKCYEYGLGVIKNDCEAVTWYEKAAENGDTGSKIILAVKYENGIGVNSDNTESINWYKKAASDGIDDVLLYLGIKYELGIGVDKNRNEAVIWYQKAANKGNIYAMRYLSVAYHSGQGITKNEDKAIELYTAFVARSDRKTIEYFTNSPITVVEKIETAEYYKRIGELFSSFSFITKYQVCAELKANYFHKSINEYESLSNKGNADALFNLGLFYLEGIETEKNYKLAFGYFERSSKRLMDGRALFFLGRCYLFGIGIDKDANKAFICFKKGAEKFNHPYSYVLLGYCYQNGIGTKKKPRIANNCFSEMINQKQRFVKNLANRNLGLVYFYGIGVKKNFETAKKYFKEDLSVDHYSFWLQNNAFLRMCEYDYSRSESIGKDYFYTEDSWYSFLHEDDEKAYYHLNKAFQANAITYVGLNAIEFIARRNKRLHISKRQSFQYASALYAEPLSCDDKLLMGQYYYYGYGTKKNLEKAFSYFEDAYIEGNDHARIYVALCYAMGDGVEQDLERARTSLERELSSKQPEALFLYGLLIFGGYWGYKKDRNKGLQILKNCSIGNERREAMYECLSSPHGDSYVSFFYNQIIIILKYSFSPKGAFFASRKAHIHFNLLWLLKKPDSPSLSKKELNRILMERASEVDIRIEAVDKKVDTIAQTQKPILEKLDEISANTSYLPEMHSTVQSIDSKIDVVLSTIKSIESEVLALKSKSALDMVSKENEEEKYGKFIKEATEMIMSSLKAKTASFSAEEAYLHDLFGEYWNHLDKYTKDSLVSARVLFTNSNRPEYHGLDYSGIVISATSALENELKLRIFDGYQKYLYKKYGQPRRPQWPESMIFEKNNGEIVRNAEFTIGSMPYIFGVYKPLPQTEKEELNRYLKTILNNKNYYCGIDSFTTARKGGQSIISRCESVRTDYRNKAAHTNPVKKLLAENCCNKICDAITASEKIETIQGLLLDIVKLTSKYNN